MAKQKSKQAPRIASKAGPGKPQVERITLKDLPRVSNPFLQLNWVDLVDISIRGDIGIATLRFYALVKESQPVLMEVARLSTPVAHVSSMAEVFGRLVANQAADAEVTE